MSARRHATALEPIHVTVPERAVEAYERALAQVCGTVGLFEADDEQRCWRVEGIKDEGSGEAALAAALSIAALRRCGASAPRRKAGSRAPARRSPSSGSAAASRYAARISRRRPPAGA